MNAAVRRVVTLLTLTLLLAACSEPAPELPINTRMGGSFSMIDQHGQLFNTADLNDKLTLMFFGFTHCPDICPATLFHTVASWKQLSERQREQVQLVFVSFDPQRDTPEHLETYLAFFDPSIIGLTGTEQQVADMASGYGVIYMQEKTEPQQKAMFSHSDFVYLLDQQGRVRKLFKSDFDQQELLNGIRSLL